LPLTRTDVKPDAHGELITRVKHWTERLIEVMDCLEEAAPADLMPVTGIEFGILCKLDAHRKGLLDTQHMPAAGEVSTPVLALNNGPPHGSKSRI